MQWWSRRGHFWRPRQLKFSYLQPHMLASFCHTKAALQKARNELLDFFYGKLPGHLPMHAWVWLHHSASSVFPSVKFDYITSDVWRSSDRTSVFSVGGGSDFTVTKSCKWIKKANIWIISCSFKITCSLSILTEFVVLINVRAPIEYLQSSPKQDWVVPTEHLNCYIISFSVFSINLEVPVALIHEVIHIECVLSGNVHFAAAQHVQSYMLKCYV